MKLVDWLLTDDKDTNIQLEPIAKYKSYRFKELDINSVTIKNYRKKLVSSLIIQVEMFIPPSGSFETADLRRYLELIQTYETSTNDMVLGLSLADQIRIAFSDMKAATICDRFPDIDLNSKRRYRCVAEYLLRQEELIKVNSVIALIDGDTSDKIENYNNSSNEEPNVHEDIYISPNPFIISDDPYVRIGNVNSGSKIN